MFLLRPSEKKPIITERLFLRAAEESDWEAYYGWFSSPEAMKYWYVSLRPQGDKFVIISK